MPMIKFKYDLGECPFCKTDTQYSRKGLLKHLMDCHSWFVTLDDTYKYVLSFTKTIRNYRLLIINGPCGCGCGELTLYDNRYMPHGKPPFFKSGHRSRITGPNSGTFKKGIIPWNADLAGKGICKPNSGSFKKGNIPPQENGGVYTAPNGQVLYWNGKRQPCGVRKYVPRSRMVMEAILERSLTSNEVVIHLDNNARNDDPKNLKVITRKENQTRNRWGDGYKRKSKVRIPLKDRPIKKAVKPKSKPKKLKSKVKKVKKEIPIRNRVEDPVIAQPVQEVRRSPFCPKCHTMRMPGAECPRC